MQSTLQKEFVDWLMQNAFKRDVTGLIRQQHRGKSLEELLDIEFGDDYDEEEQKEVWRSNYGQIESWYQLEYFFERSYDDLAESWFVGEVITSIEADGDRDLVWGIKNDTHLNLKLREWVERFDNGEIILVSVSDEIPQKFGGDLETEGRYKMHEGEWVKFRYDSDRREIIENIERSSDNQDSLQSHRNSESLKRELQRMADPPLFTIDTLKSILGALIVWGGGLAGFVIFILLALGVFKFLLNLLK